MKSRSFALATLLALGAIPSFAVPIAFVDGTASFAANHIGAGLAFTDSFEFAVAQSNLLSAGVLSIALYGGDAGQSRDYDIQSVSLTGPGGIFGFTRTGNNDLAEFYQLPVTSLMAGIYTLSVMGSVDPLAAAGNFQGMVNISPIPEPKTYSLMFAGLAAMGFVVRRLQANKAMR